MRAGGDELRRDQGLWVLSFLVRAHWRHMPYWQFSSLVVLSLLAAALGSDDEWHVLLCCYHKLQP